MGEAYGQRCRPGNQHHQHQAAGDLGDQDAGHAHWRGAQHGQVASFVDERGGTLLAAKQVRQVRHRQHAEPEAHDVRQPGERITREDQQRRQAKRHQAEQGAGAPAGVARDGAPVLQQDCRDGTTG